MICPYCGHENSDDIDICENCDFDFDLKKEAEPTPAVGIIAIIAGIFVLIPVTSLFISNIQVLLKEPFSETTIIFIPFILAELIFIVGGIYPIVLGIMHLRKIEKFPYSSEVEKEIKLKDKKVDKKMNRVFLILIFLLYAGVLLIFDFAGIKILMENNYIGILPIVFTIPFWIIILKFMFSK